MTETKHTVCPQCNALWTLEEVEYQACDNCGYPLHKEQAEKKDIEFDFTKSPLF